MEENGCQWTQSQMWSMANLSWMSMVAHLNVVHGKSELKYLIFHGFLVLCNFVYLNYFLHSTEKMNYLLKLVNRSDKILYFMAGCK